MKARGIFAIAAAWVLGLVDRKRTTQPAPSPGKDFPAKHFSRYTKRQTRKTPPRAFGLAGQKRHKYHGGGSTGNARRGPIGADTVLDRHWYGRPVQIGPIA